MNLIDFFQLSERSLFNFQRLCESMFLGQLF